jgi:phage tail protein X
MSRNQIDAQVLTALEGEMLDAMVWRHYGRIDVLALVIEANRQWARLPVTQMLRLPGGTPVLMPALNDQPVLPLVRIWS